MVPAKNQINLEIRPVWSVFVFHMKEGLDGGGVVWYSLFIQNLVHYSSQ